MTVRQTNHLIVAAAGLVAVACIVVLTAGLGMEVRVQSADLIEGDTVATLQPKAPTQGPAARPEHDLAELRRICQRDLRRPLFDPPATPVPAEFQVPLSLSLIGIVNEPGHSMALIQKGDSSVVLCAVGETVESPAGVVTIVAVEPQSVTVRHGQSLQKLELSVPVSAQEGTQ